ncbi:MAG: hypothetical protein V1800_03925 [Candidatus Latescibacterota bacterium]
MITWLLMGIAVTGATLLWPINRWVIQHGGKTTLYGFWACAVSALASGGIAWYLGQALLQPRLWIIGIIVGIASVTGFWRVGMHCLRIGPIGPTVAMNNMGMLWPVILGSFWLQPRALGGRLTLGLGLVSLAIIVMGLSSSRKSSPDAPAASAMSLRWFLWALLAWILSGISMSGQYAAALYVPDSPAAAVFAFSAVSAVLLAFPAYRCAPWGKWRELGAGVTCGFLVSAVGMATLTMLRFFGPEIVFPVTTATPAVSVLLLGYVLYREHLGIKGVLACSLGIAGIVLLSMG